MSHTAATVQPSEDDLQRQIVDGLRLFKYTVIVTSQRRHRCAQCGTYSHRGSGNDRGLGDLLVWVVCPDGGRWIMADVKKPGGKISPEQQAHVDGGRMYIWHDFDEAAGDIRRIAKCLTSS